MKQSNKRDYLFYLFLFIFTLAFVWMEIPELRSEMRDDAYRIGQLIVQPPELWGQTSDWHELLFIYEGRFLWQTLHLLFPNIEQFLSEDVASLALRLNLFKQAKIDAFSGMLSMVFVFYFMWGCCTFLMYVMLCRLFYSMREKKSILFVFLTFLIFSFAFIEHYHYALFFKYLDGFFYPVIVSALIGVRLCYISNKRKRWFWVCFVLICLFHCVGYRRVSVLLLPVFFVWLIPIFFHVKRPLFRVIAALGATCIFGGVVHLALSALPSRHDYPAVVMLYSDLATASLLSGDQKEFQEYCAEVEARGQVIENLNITHNSIHQYYSVSFYKGDSKFVWEHTKRAYLNYLLKRPKEMILGKTISIIQFYSNFHVPEFIKRFVVSLFPNAHLNEKSWCVRPLKNHDTGGSYEKIYLFSVALVTLIGFCICRDRLDGDLRFFMFVSLVGFVYSVSYWPVVPTPDARYHSFPVLAQCLFLSYVAARVCVYAWRYCRKKQEIHAQ